MTVFTPEHHEILAYVVANLVDQDDKHPEYREALNDVRFDLMELFGSDDPTGFDTVKFGQMSRTPVRSWTTIPT